MAEATSIDSDKYYDLNRFKEPGHLIIFNHNKFDDKTLKPRPGTEYDVTKLKNVFSKFRFKIHPPHDDFTAKEIEEKIKYYASLDYSSCGSVAVFVLTHGENDGKLHARDKIYYNKMIWQPFLSNNSLQGKLKFFGFQACRSEVLRLDKRWETVAVDGHLSDTQPPEGPKTPHHPDVLVAYSTVEDRSAVRNPGKGSWFIQTLCEELLLETLPGEGTDLITLLTKVHARIVHEKEFSEGLGQTPTFVSFLSKPVVLSLSADRMPFDPASSEISHKSSCSEKYVFPKSILQEKSHPRGAERVNIKTFFFDEYDVLLAKRALIYYDTEHHSRAQRLEAIFQNLKLDVTCNELNMNFQDDIKKESSLHSQKSDISCLVIAVMATMSEDFVHVNKDHHVKIKDVWKPFINLKCKGLASKPKLFFFLDALDANNIPNTIKSGMQTDGVSNVPFFVTEHSDFLFVRGFGNKFVDKLFAELRHSNCESLVNVVTRASENSEKTQSGLLSHIESTLRYAVVFKEQQQDQMAQAPPALSPSLVEGDAGPSISSTCEGPPAKETEIRSQGTSHDSGRPSQSCKNQNSRKRRVPANMEENANLIEMSTLKLHIPYEVYLMKWEKNREKNKFKKPKGETGRNEKLVVYILEEESGIPSKVYLPRCESKARENKLEFDTPKLLEYNKGVGTPYMLTVLKHVKINIKKGTKILKETTCKITLVREKKYNLLNRASF